tara:strand:- start:1775 stop:2173 length:399 start_codon:yes stop_codon:yes gene_type:complete
MEDLKALNVRHFKLVNGDEIVALVSVKNNDNWILERPLTVSNNILGSYQFAPWFPFSEAKLFKVLKTHVIQHVPISDNVKESYVKLALQTKTQIPEQARSDEELLAEYEQKLIDRYAEEGDIPEPDVPETIH